METVRFVKWIMMAAACAGAAILAACAPPSSVVIATAAPETASPSLSAPAASSAPEATPLATTRPDENTAPDEALLPDDEPADVPLSAQRPADASVVVRDGDTLERDIIPQLCAAFGMGEEEVKSALAGADSRLIGSKADGFRRMEGIIVPGEYAAAGKTLDVYVDLWIKQAEQRFDRVAAACSQSNGLKPHEQLTLASIVEWECIGDEFEREAAAAFLNRLDDGAKLRSCATTEYALGYQRPYLTSADVAAESRYNTYQVKGLPPGPICSVDDDSLAAGICPAIDKKIYYFFYDYAPDTMRFFSDYGAFKAAASESVALFESTFDIGRHDKIDKRGFFGSKQE